MLLKKESLKPEWSFVDELEALIPELRALARSYCGNNALADDVVQSACLKAWSCAESYDTRLPMKNWVFRILRNEYFQYYRNAWRLTKLEADTLEETLVDQNGSEVTIDLPKIVQAVDALPLKQRDALILVHAAGLTYNEAGRVLNCSAGTVKSRVSRGRMAVLTDVESCRLAPLSEANQRYSIQTLLDRAELLMKESVEVANQA